MINTKNNLILGISLAAIIISLVTITIPLLESSQATSQHYTGKTREFWLFNSEIPGFNETKMMMPHDVYSMPVISAFKGDTIVIHFFNTEEIGGDHHSFTIKDQPYDKNVDLSPGQNATITLTADTIGTFAYYCTYHQPVMRGQLIIQLPPY